MMNGAENVSLDLEELSADNSAQSVIIQCEYSQLLHFLPAQICPITMYCNDPHRSSQKEARARTHSRKDQIGHGSRWSLIWSYAKATPQKKERNEQSRLCGQTRLYHHYCYYHLGRRLQMLSSRRGYSHWCTRAANLLGLICMISHKIWLNIVWI